MQLIAKRPIRIISAPAGLACRTLQGYVATRQQSTPNDGLRTVVVRLTDLTCSPAYELLGCRQIEPELTPLARVCRCEGKVETGAPKINVRTGIACPAMGSSLANRLKKQSQPTLCLTGAQGWGDNPGSVLL